MNFCCLDARRWTYFGINFIGVIAVGKTSSTESSDANQMQVFDIDIDAPRSLRPRKGTRGSVECITGRMVSALDKCRVSDRDAIHLLIATAEGMRRDPKNLIINRSSLRKRRTENRKKIADFVKENPQVIYLSLFIVKLLV